MVGDLVQRFFMVFEIAWGWEFFKIIFDGFGAFGGDPNFRIDPEKMPQILGHPKPSLSSDPQYPPIKKLVLLNSMIDYITKINNCFLEPFFPRTNLDKKKTHVIFYVHDQILKPFINHSTKLSKIQC
jgi:hypothetical protein